MPSFFVSNRLYEVPALPDNVQSDWISDNYYVLDAHGAPTLPSDHVLDDLFRAAAVLASADGISAPQDLLEATGQLREVLNSANLVLDAQSALGTAYTAGTAWLAMSSSGFNPVS